MAVTVKTKMTFSELCELFEVHSAAATEASLYGCTLKVEPSKIQIVYNDGKPDSAQVEVPVKFGVLSMAQAGTLGTASKGMVRSYIEGAINDLLTLIGSYSKTKKGEETTDKILDSPKKFTKQSGKKKTAKKVKATKTKIKEGVMDTKPVALKDAKELLQPIKGTDQESIYYAIAVGPLVNVGARIRSTGYTSFRVEGNGIEEPEVTKALHDAGLNHSTSGHWSIHFDINPGKKTLIKKTVGALLYAIGLPFDAVVSDISPIMGKGH